MLMIRILRSMLFLSFVVFTGSSPLRASGCEDTIARHMVGEALLAAHFVAVAEQTGMTAGAIDAIPWTSCFCRLLARNRIATTSAIWSRSDG